MFPLPPIIRFICESCSTPAPLSQVCGFGASVAAIRPCRARQLSRLSDRRHDLVRLQRDKDVFDVNGPSLKLILERLKQQD